MVYIIQQGHDGPFKIGWTSDICTFNKRRGNLQVGSALELREIHLIADGSMDLEAELHTYLQAFNTSGEWFANCRGVRRFIDDLRWAQFHPNGNLEYQQLNEAAVRKKLGLDTNPNNNHPENLELVTQTENMHRRFRAAG